MKKLLPFTLIIFSCLSVFGQSASSAITDKEYEIIMTVLSKNREMFVIRNETFLDEIAEAHLKNRIKEGMKELLDETLVDFTEKNKKQVQIEKKFPTKIIYTLISFEELENFYSLLSNQNDGDMDWEKYYKKYPKSGGIFKVSRVGLSRDDKQALLFVANWCGELCGKGIFYLLNKENDVWKIVKETSVWVS